METEKLKCDSCSKTWQRQKTRGRKPKVCPNCVIKAVEEEEDQEEILDIPLVEPPPSSTKFKAGTKWRCNSCGVSIKVNVGINEPPTHACKKRMRRVYALERV